MGVALSMRRAPTQVVDVAREIQLRQGARPRRVRAEGRIGGCPLRRADGALAAIRFVDGPVERVGLMSVNPASAPSIAASDLSAPLVALRGVDKVFGNRLEALKGLNIEVRAGEFLSLLGPSGCGKSTALRLLAGLTTPTRGEIDWRGGRPALSFVFQDSTLMPWATVFANVWLPLRLCGLSREGARPRVEEALAMVGLSGFSQAYPRELSGGMKMRASIARALVTRPAVLLMDEPFAALDEITRLKLNDDLLALRSALGATVVFVTHSVFESVYLSSRIVVIAARPGRAFAQIEIDAAAPRNVEFRMSRTYAEKCRETSVALHAAMAAPGGAQSSSLEGARE